MALAKAMGILANAEDLSLANGNSCSGFYVVLDGVGNMKINNNLTEAMQRIVAAHELGHAVLNEEIQQECGKNL